MAYMEILVGYCLAVNNFQFCMSRASIYSCYLLKVIPTMFLWFFFSKRITSVYHSTHRFSLTTLLFDIPCSYSSSFVFSLCTLTVACGCSAVREAKWPGENGRWLDEYVIY